MEKQNFKEQYSIHTCLPFVKLAEEKKINMGPIIFWPASKFNQFVEEKFRDSFKLYMESISQIKVYIDEQATLVNSIRLPTQGTTLISVDNRIPDDEKELFIADSLYLLYFACSFRDLYYDNEIPGFGVFRKMIPASIDFIEKNSERKDLHINEIDREQTVCIHLVNKEICNCFGELLSAIYIENNTYSFETKENYKRIVRSIRYLVDRFFHRFVNLFEKNSYFPDVVFEPEDIIFLSSGFECLFNVNKEKSEFDLKHKLRPILHLKYTTPMEIFWKWVDDFYDVRKRIVNGGQITNPVFQSNPNFEISHISLGIKLLIYSVHYKLFTYKLLKSKHHDAFTPPDFKFIHPEEVMVFFWSEIGLLKKISLFLSRIIDEKIEDQELYSDIKLLSGLFISIQERYYGKHILGVTFIPTKAKDLEKSGKQILKCFNLMKKDPTHFRRLADVLSEKFIAYLNKRLA